MGPQAGRRSAPADGRSPSFCLRLKLYNHPPLHFLGSCCPKTISQEATMGVLDLEQQLLFVSNRIT